MHFIQHADAFSFTGRPSYLLPVVFRNALQLVQGHQLLQHPGNHDKLVLVTVSFYSEEQCGDVHYFLSGAGVVASQVLWEFLRGKQCVSLTTVGRNTQEL